MGSIAVFAGGFGSGKSEVALNYAMDKARDSTQVVLADLDLVNPYFVSRSLKAELNEKGITLIAPGGDFSFGDVPNIPARLLAYVRQDNHMIIDLAGDEVGSVVLGYISQMVGQRSAVELFLVINPYRPFAGDLESISELKANLERATRMAFTGIVSNPNLVEASDLETIIQGHSMVEAYARSLGLPVSYLAVEEHFYAELSPIYGNLLRKIQLYLRPNWLQDLYKGGM
ncbi:MAG TPA: hypothetical protein VN426_02970 [Syntrophomonadaceae bacterium]|nr:hypothetical protein [Syntrophomonadaceae bacterium]